MQSIILIDGSRTVAEAMSDLQVAFERIREEAHYEGFNAGYDACAHYNEICELEETIEVLKEELKVLKEGLDDANEEIEEQKFVIKEILTLNL